MWWGPQTSDFACFSGRHRNSCKVTRRPSSKTNGRDKSSISDIIMKVAKQMAFPIHVLHVTQMGAFRSDAHVGTWSDNPSVPDCSHWCLPGVPDMWNEILFSYMLSKNGELFQWATTVATCGLNSVVHELFPCYPDWEFEEYRMLCLVWSLELIVCAVSLAVGWGIMILSEMMFPVGSFVLLISQERRCYEQIWYAIGH